MAYKTRRRLRLEADAAREDRNKARRELAAAVEKHDMEIRQLGRQLAEQQQHIDAVEAHRDNLNAQLDMALAKQRAGGEEQ